MPLDADMINHLSLIDTLYSDVAYDVDPYTLSPLTNQEMRELAVHHHQLSVFLANGLTLLFLPLRMSFILSETRSTTAHSARIRKNDPADSFPVS